MQYFDMFEKWLEIWQAGTELCQAQESLGFLGLD